MDSDPVPSSSPAFGTPAHPFRKSRPNPPPTKTSILPILLPPATLRPVAFRTFTRKHNLTLSSSALQTLARFVGKNCGAGWREEGLAERVLDEVAKSWRKAGGGVIVDEDKGASLKAILQTLESNMSGGKIVTGNATSTGEKRPTGRSGDSILSNLQSPRVQRSDDDYGDMSVSPHFRHWIKVVDAFDMPRLTYNLDKKYFEVAKSKPTLFPPPFRKTALFRDRYNVIYQRLLRNESFQSLRSLSSSPSLQRSSTSFTSNQSYRLTPIANLLGRSGTFHLLLGLLSISHTGDLSLTDLTGSIALQLSHTRMIPVDGAWFAPGMIVLVDGIYEEEESVRGSTLGGNSGIGGTIGGRFIGVSICGPPCERRETSLGTHSRQNGGEVSSSGGLGWVDFLGVGSERARGPRMRQIQARCLQDVSAESSPRLKVAIMSEVNLDNMKTLDALRKVFDGYNRLSLRERPAVFILMGNFVQRTTINGGGEAGSIEYKEYFDALAVVMSDFPALLQHSTFIFVPGDNDPWQSAFTAGAASPLPRHAVPDLFTSRVKRAFAVANSELNRSRSSEPPGEAIWTSNPSRLSLFGPIHDIAILRDDMSGRMRRTAVSMQPDLPGEINGIANGDTPTTSEDQAGDHVDAKSNPASPRLAMARKLVKTVLDQGSMSPFPLSLRPVLWDYASSLQLYPLPTGFVLADSDVSSFCMTYEGCHVMNPGRLIPEGDTSSVKWIEYDVIKNRGRVKEERC